MNDILKEIDRVKAAMAKSNSEYLKRDYAKYLAKLEKKLKIMKNHKTNASL